MRKFATHLILISAMVVGLYGCWREPQPHLGVVFAETFIQRYVNICENKNGNVVSKTTISENDYVHCCWGWSNGKANGWYISDVFDISQTQNYDNPNIAVDEELKVHYRYWMRMVTYDKPNQN